MSSIYDIFRSVQEKRDTCYDERSAAFIIEGAMSKNIYHSRLEKTIPAALVFSHKEGPDEVIVYTLLEDDLLKGDYFVYDSVNYLVYEQNKLTDTDIIYKKQKAVECNVSFLFSGETFVGYYKSSVRGSEDPSFEGRQLLMPDETPLLILPTNDTITVNSEFIIEGKPFRVIEYDHITNKGITYYYLERGIIRRTEAEANKTTTMSATQPTIVIQENQPVVQDQDSEQLILRAMVEYTFLTEDAVFSATPAVELIQRKRNEIKFKVPFGIGEVAITTKIDGLNVQKLYKVVI